MGALFFEISPYMASAGVAHLDLIAVPIPPLILLLLDEILVRQSARAARIGVALGVLIGLQLLISPEVFATTILMSVIGVILLVPFRWTEVRARVGYAVSALAWGVMAALVVDVYPMWLFLFGPEHFNGPIQSRLALNPLSNDLLSLFVPSSVQRLDPSGLQHVTDVIAPGGLWAAENGAYVGIPLFAILVLIVVRYWRIGIVRFAAAMTTVALILSLGPTLIVDGHSTGFPLPFRAVVNLPFFDDLVASRFSLYTGFFIALLLAVGVDHLARSEWRIRSRRGWLIATAVLGAVGLVSVLPSWPYPTSKPNVPTLLRQSAADGDSARLGASDLPVPPLAVRPTDVLAGHRRLRLLAGGWLHLLGHAERGSNVTGNAVDHRDVPRRLRIRRESDRVGVRSDVGGQRPARLEHLDGGRHLRRP